MDATEWVLAMLLIQQQCPATNRQAWQHTEAPASGHKQVELALQSDPENEELKKLQHDLQELISMFEAVAEPTSPKKKDTYHQQPPSSTPSAPASTTAATTTTALKAHEFSVDQEVMARWSGDGEFYKATITAIGGADQVFSVKFKGYSEAEFVKAEDIKPLQSKKRTGVFESVGEPKKKRKDTTTLSASASAAAGGGAVAPTGKKKKAAEFESKKNAWLNFATGSSKKKKATPVINKKSIFKTPDNPEGKVGVIGSGKGMTSYQQRDVVNSGPLLDDGAGAGHFTGTDNDIGDGSALDRSTLFLSFITSSVTFE
ncbi:survival of motor neuron-related-splicing factor 30 isoform X1 [Mucor ambiguus]|uniref:Survival of motor neuron-related-splicing factor 30 isoform X1 n=1 Tax=Mucor ambiguus TaxID=91626 RepID=A0A0C9M4L3_9FUNG|nr:survival of motor neuron-related-splicing factor 30 isoform X1 [Mucor ambiguus]